MVIYAKKLSGFQGDFPPDHPDSRVMPLGIFASGRDISRIQDFCDFPVVFALFLSLFPLGVVKHNTDSLDGDGLEFFPFDGTQATVI